MTSSVPGSIGVAESAAFASAANGSGELSLPSVAELQLAERLAGRLRDRLGVRPRIGDGGLQRTLVDGDLVGDRAA